MKSDPCHLSGALALHLPETPNRDYFALLLEKKPISEANLESVLPKYREPTPDVPLESKRVPTGPLAPAQPLSSTLKAVTIRKQIQHLEKTVSRMLAALDVSNLPKRVLAQSRVS